jgi:hypothetical protein
MSCYLGAAHLRAGLNVPTKRHPVKPHVKFSENTAFGYKPGESMLSFSARNGSVGMSIAQRTELHHAYDNLRTEHELNKEKMKKYERLQKRAAIENRFTMNSLRKPWSDKESYYPLIYNTSLPSPFENEINWKTRMHDEDGDGVVG